MRNTKLILLAAAFGLGLGAGAVVMSLVSGSADQASGKQPSAERKPLYWAAPMDKSYRSDSPGLSPMGMELIPVYADDESEGDDRNLVRINPAVENNIGVRTAIVATSEALPAVETVGTVQIDDDNTSVVDVRTEGWIENMPVKAIGDEVRKGQLLFQIYSRPLVSAQDEYLQATRMGNQNLITATKSRLVSLGMSNRAIESLKESGQSERLLNVYSPRSGIVTQMGAGEGGFVKPGMNVLKIADLRTVWAIADVYEDQVHQVRPGQEVTMRMSGMPGREGKGLVEYIYPTVNARARTVQVRISFDNKDGLLRPDMFVRLRIETSSDVPSADASDKVVIPREALIRTGRTERVILALGDGRYQPAQVVSGREIGDDIEILSGLAAGERIVVSSQFLLDSEASLRGTMLRLTAGQDEDAPMNMGSSSEMRQEGAPETQPADTAQTRGMVVSVMQAHGMVTIEHAPVEALGWPSMTMAFVTDPALLKDIGKGDNVDITVRAAPDDNGNYVLSDIRKISPARVDAQ